MGRLLNIIKKELICTRENVIFNAATITAPLFFLIIFTFMLSDGVSFPFNVSTTDSGTAFVRVAEEFKAPNSIGYIELVETDKEVSKDASHDAIAVEEDFNTENGVISGKLVHYVNDVNQNTLKNSRNRINGAIVEYLHQERSSGNVRVIEKTTYEEDIPWAAGFGTSTFAFGIMIAGLFFGTLSIISEYDNRTTIFLKLSPYPVGYVLFGKIATCLIKCFISGAIYLAAYILIFHEGVDNIPIFLATVFFGYTAFIGIGMMIGIALKTAVTSLVACVGTAFALWILGGGFGPLTFFGKWANLLANLNPVTYVVNSIKWCFFGGTASMVMPIIVIVCFAAVAILISSGIYIKWTAKQEG